MFIKFNYLKFKNFNSYGNTLTTFDFTKGLHLITANVGAGKSTIIDALTYNLFGSPYRDVRLSELLNRTNKKDLYTECNFNVGNDNYNIIRTMKKDTLCIKKNGENISLLSSKKLDQDEINKILGIDYKMFKQIISLAFSYNKPYFKMSAAEKRETIETIFNIKIFGQMEKIAKNKIKNLKVDISINDSTLKVMENNINSQRSNIKDFKNMKENFQKEKEKEIDELGISIINDKKTIDVLDKNILEIEPKIKILKEKTKDNTELKKKQDLYYTKLQKLETDKTNYKHYSEKQESIVVELVKLNSKKIEKQEQIEKLKKDFKEIKFYDLEKIRKEENLIITKITKYSEKIKQLDKEINFLNTDICPTCKRELDEKYKEENRIRLNKEKDEFQNIINESENLKLQLVENLRLQEESNKKYSKLESNIIIEENEFKRIVEDIKKFEMQQKENDDRLDNFKIEEILNETKKIKIELKKIIEDFNKIEKNNKEKNNFEIELNNFISKKDFISKRIIESEEKIKNVNNKKFEMNIDEIEKKFNEDVKKYSELYNDNISKNKLLSNYRLICNILSSDGIKSYYLKKLIPILNQSVNNYLQTFELPIRLEFNEKMEDKIYGLGGFNEELSYHSHSGGERQKIDMSIFLAYIETCKTVSNWNSSLLIVDELLDTATDQETLEKILTQFKKMTDFNRGSSIYVISHKSGELKNYFDSIIEVEKINGFSKIVS